MKLFITNQNNSERVLRFILAILLLPSIFILDCTTYSIILAIIGLITTVISAFYYLRIIKIIYFDKPKKPFDESYDWGLKSVLILSSGLILIYFIYPSVLTNIISSITIY